MEGNMGDSTNMGGGCSHFLEVDSVVNVCSWFFLIRNFGVNVDGVGVCSVEPLEQLEQLEPTDYVR